MEGLGFVQSFLLQLLNQIPFVPSNRFAQLSQEAEFSSKFKSHDFQCLGNVGLFGIGIWVGAALENLESFQGSLSSGGLVREHSSNASPEELGRGLEVVGSSLSWVAIGDFVLPFEILNSSVIKESAEDDFFGSDDDDSLSAEQFLGNDSGHSSHHVSFGIDNNLLLKHRFINFILFINFAKIF